LLSGVGVAVFSGVGDGSCVFVAAGAGISVAGGGDSPSESSTGSDSSGAGSAISGAVVAVEDICSCRSPIISVEGTSRSEHAVKIRIKPISRRNRVKLLLNTAIITVLHIVLLKKRAHGLAA
jgi:hypothetical protein